MPGGRGKPKRSCPMCKAYKFMGNATGRHTPREEALRKILAKEAQEA